MPTARRSQRRMTEGQAAFVLLLPFLATYALFLVYPFFRGIWISLHDWNLLAVAFNPDAKEYVGLRNYERVMWGRNIAWAAFASPMLQVLGLIGLGAFFWSLKSGQFDDLDGAAERILTNDDDLPPGPATGGTARREAAEKPTDDKAFQAFPIPCH